MADDETFESTSSGASETYPIQCSALRKNGHVILKDKPCKIVEMSTSKTGKHGHAKVHLVGLDIFTNKKYEDICPSTHNMNVPNIVRKDFTCVDSDGDCLSVMDDEGGMREDLRHPEGEIGSEIADRLKKGEEFLVTVLKAMGQEQVVSIKQSTKD